MALDEYNRKRDFTLTKEPVGAENSEFQHRYVIQRHAARRLHYDLRLEMEGVLRSWAVPKGPSMNPEDKRLAIHTEDHPIKYLHFQGIIPKGNYGAGEMTIWDEGNYTTYKTPENPQNIVDEYYDGALHLIFDGQKLQGKFTLVLTNYGKNDQWLLIKQDDEHADDAPYSAEDYPSIEIDVEVEVNDLEEDEGSLSSDEMISPMLATPVEKAFDDPDWLFELKYDGYRVSANIRDHKVKLYSRNGITYDKKFSEVDKELSSIDHNAILDGEMIVMDRNGHPLFQALQNYNNSTRGRLQYMVFDLLYLNGHSLLNLPLTDRKQLLRNILPDGKYVKFCDHIPEEGLSFYREVADQGLEGIIAKRKNSRYYPGKRSEDWLKIKQIQTADPVICGYTYSEKAERPFGSLILGMEKNDQLYYCGNCGSGFSHDKMDVLFERFQSLKREKSPFVDKINLKGRIPQWLSPELVCEIKFSEVTSEGRFRHPVFLRMRPDKKNPLARLATAIHSSSSTSPNQESLEVNGITISVSNLEKVYWPESGLRKYDLLEYYIAISDVMLPYLIDRPQNLHRHPDGIDQPGFYQKDYNNIVNWMQVAKLHSKSANKDINYLLCQNEATLLHMVNLGCIEINPWLSRVDHIDHPDYAVIDLDPSSSNTFEQIIETALVAKEVLDQVGIQGWVKTSGSSGIHIYIPLGVKYTYDQARDFVRLLCILVHKRLPKTTTMERSLKKRGPKIYLDYLQNRRGQTIVSPYSVRPVPGAWVSAPVTWDELAEGFELRDFNLHTLPARLEEKGDLFSGVFTSKINMMNVIENLEQSR